MAEDLRDDDVAKRTNQKRESDAKQMRLVGICWHLFPHGPHFHVKRVIDEKEKK